MGLGSPVTRLRGRGGLERGLSAVSGLLPNPPPPQKNIPPAITGRKRIHLTAGQFPKWEGSHACFRFFQFGFFFFFFKDFTRTPPPPISGNMGYNFVPPTRSLLWDPDSHSRCQPKASHRLQFSVRVDWGIPLSALLCSAGRIYAFL